LEKTADFEKEERLAASKLIISPVLDPVTSRIWLLVGLTTTLGGNREPLAADHCEGQLLGKIS
jgi:hypothetical protein